MVKSRLEPAINYHERKVMEESDKNYSTMLYDSQLFNEKVLIALGQRKKKTPAVYYYPIYLVNDDGGKVIMPLGVYEVWAHLNVKDVNGDVDLLKLGEPLLYKNVTKDAIKALQPTKNKKDDKVDWEKEYKEQTLEEAVDERVEKVPAISPWIQRFMKNPNYKIDSSNANNMFATIAFSKTSWSEADLRKRVAKYATMPIFLNYKTIYDDAKTTFLAAKDRVQVLKTKIDLLKHDLVRSNDRSTQAKLLTELEKTQAEIKQIALEQGPIKELIKDYYFMAGLDTIDLFKLKLQTADYLGDLWALNVLSRDLPLNILLFSYEHFKKGDLDHVLLHLGGVTNLNSGQPFILLAALPENQYSLITYKDLSTFPFYKALPYDIKQLITIKPNSNSNSNVGLVEESNNNLCEPGLCDESTVFQFYSKALGKPWPGKGAGEKVAAKDQQIYKDLAANEEWRKQLDNFWPAPIHLDGLHWSTVEHYYQAAKFKRTNPDFRRQFSIESNSALSKDPLLAKYAGSKTGLYKKDGENGKIVVARPKSILRDPDFNHSLTLEMGLRAKFTQHPLLGQMLRLTRSAKLMYFPGRGLTPIVYNELMRVRKNIL